MYQHKLCSETYLPLDVELLKATKMHEQPRPDLPLTRPSFKARSPSTKLSDFLRQAHPSRSASIMSKRSQKAGNSAHERPSTSQGPPSPSFRFSSVRRMQRTRPRLFPAFPSLSDDKPVAILSDDKPVAVLSDDKPVAVKLEKPLPSEPAFDFEKFFRRPLTSTSPRTRARPSAAQPVQSTASIHDFIDESKSQTTPVRYSFIVQTETLNDKERSYHKPLAGLPCGGSCISSPFDNPPASASLAGRAGYCPDNKAYQLRTPSLSPAFVPWPTSPCERLSKCRKRQDTLGKPPRKPLSRSQTDPVPVSAACQSWMDDSSTTSVIGSRTSHKTSGNAHSGSQVRGIKSKHRTDSTQMSLVCTFSFDIGAVMKVQWLD